MKFFVCLFVCLFVTTSTTEMTDTENHEIKERSDNTTGDTDLTFASILNRWEL